MARLVPSALVVVVILTAHNALCFLPNFGGKSITHSNITKMAALRAVLKLFQEVPSPEGKVLPRDAFQPEGADLTAEKLFEAYYGATVSVTRFKHALKIMTISNTKVDLKYVLDGKRHFDSETLLEAKRILLRLKARVIQTILQGSFHAALRTMGTMLHTLQDFYSHSNWIELGFKTPNTNLIKPGASIGTIAGKTERTCTDCSSGRSCKDKILESIIQRKVITTGYFGFNPLSKPEGKCSHGGTADLTKQGSEGMNKDSVTSPHSQYHAEAARVATAASLEVFQDVRDTVGDEAFLKFLKVNSPTGLSFVIDTTGSMRDDIEAAKQRTINIVKNRRGTRDEPSFYILVPFNDPEFGPVFKTSDPDKFIEQLRMLRADGGGDIPEMSLSALQLALTHTPPLSYIYVFTDAPAKDFELSRTIVALIEQVKCKVSFLLTNALTRRRRSTEDEHSNTLYKHLAQVSGGLAVIIHRQVISQLTAIIADTATAALVIVMQRDSNPSYLENSFPFHVDHALHNVTIYISGNPANFKISNPRGVQQSSAVNSGDLGSVEHIGDLYIVRLHSPTDVGEWDLIVSSGTRYSVKVTGQSVVDFMYDFIESFPGPHPGFAPLSGRPMAGMPGVLAITVTGLPVLPSFLVQEFALLDPQGEVLQKEALRPTASPDTFLVEFPSLPVIGFYVRLSGQEEDKLPFRRQSTTLNSVTNTKVKVIAEPTFRAGTKLNVSFTITNSGRSSLYKVRLTDDQNLTPSQPFSFNINNNQSVEGLWVIAAPTGMEPGTLLTLTVEAESQFDFGYSIVQLIIASQVEDLSPPTCAITSMNRTCPPAGPAQCDLQRWSLAAQFIESGTGQVAVYARRGNGSLAWEEKRDSSRSVTLAHYNASCCFPDVDLVGVDLAGNVGTCSTRANSRGPGPAGYSTAALLATYLASCFSHQLA